MLDYTFHYSKQMPGLEGQLARVCEVVLPEDSITFHGQILEMAEHRAWAWEAVPESELATSPSREVDDRIMSTLHDMLFMKAGEAAMMLANLHLPH